MSASEKTERARRKHLIYSVIISSSDGECFTGRLVNISLSGLKVVTKGKLFLGATYHLEISLPEETNGSNNISCTGKTIWCKRNTNRENSSAGFEIVEMDETNKTILSELTKDFNY